MLVLKQQILILRFLIVCAYIPDTHSDPSVGWLPSVYVEENLNWLPALGFVHERLTCLHISHHTVTVSCSNISFCIFLSRYPVSFPFFLCLKLTKAHRQGHMVKVDWLDRLTFREIEMINEVRKITFSTVI